MGHHDLFVMSPFFPFFSFFFLPFFPPSLLPQSARTEARPPAGGIGVALFFRAVCARPDHDMKNIRSIPREAIHERRFAETTRIPDDDGLHLRFPEPVGRRHRVERRRRDGREAGRHGARENPTFAFEHDVPKGVFRLTWADGRVEVFRDQPVRHLVLEADAETGELKPVVRGGVPVVPLPQPRGAGGAVRG